MTKQKLREAILNVLMNNAEPMSANDIAVALSGEANAKDLTACLKGLISEGEVERIDGDSITFALIAAPVAESTAEEIGAGISADLVAEETAPVFSMELEQAFAALEAPKPEVHNADMKLAVLDRLSALMDDSISDVLGDIKNDLQQIAA